MWKKFMCLTVLLFSLLLIKIPPASAASAASDEWATYRGDNTVRYADGAMYVDGGSGISSIYYTGAVYSTYEMTADLTVVSQGTSGISSGIVYRTNDDIQGLLLLKTGDTKTNPRALKYAENTTYSIENNAIRSSDYTTFELGETVGLKVSVNKNGDSDIINAWVMVAGKDAGYRALFENEPIPGIAGKSGFIGFFLAEGTIKIDNVHIKNTLTGEEKIMNFDQPVDSALSGSKIYSYTGNGVDYSGSCLSFDGNSCAVMSDSLIQMPDTIEAWFRTPFNTLQPIMDNYRNATVEPNPFRLQITSAGKVRYYEMNGSSGFSVESQGSYCDGNWYRAALTRSYKNQTGILTITLYVFDSKGGLIEKSWSTQQLCERKVRDYAENGHFTNMTPPYLGTDWFHENYMTGEIGELSLWSRALTEEELIARHNAVDRTDGLIYHLAFYKTPEGTFACDTIGGRLTAELMGSWINEVTFHNGDYSILVLPDSQRLVKYTPEQVNTMFGWIRDNADKLGIKLVMSVGDMVNDKTEAQYATISNAAKLIYGKVPFLIIDGNHDYGGGSRDIALFKKTFDTATWQNQTGYTGSYEVGTMSNSYYIYNFGGDKYIFLMLELAPRDGVIAWANKILNEYSDYRAIITTHAYLDVSGTYLNIDDYNTFYATHWVYDSDTDAAKLWKSLISLNKNIQMVFSGHMGCSDIVWRTDRGINGNTVYTFCIDGEKMDSDFGGVGSVALFNFTDSGNRVGINYYSVSKNKLIGEKNQFSLTLDAPVSYIGCQTGADNALRLVAGIDSVNYSKVGFDLTICNLSDGVCTVQTVTGTEVYRTLRSISDNGTALLDACGFGKEYIAALPVIFPGDCLIFVRPFCISEGVRTEGQPVILTYVKGEVHQARFTGGER